MKKVIKTKAFLAGCLSVLCIAILATSLLWRGGSQSEFVPDAFENPDSTAHWTEASGDNAQAFEQSKSIVEKTLTTDQVSNQQDAFPKILEENEEEVVIEFTPVIPYSEPHPEKPIEDLIIYDDPGDPPLEEIPPNLGTTVKPPNSNAATSENSNSNGNNNGNLVDPVFGAIKPVESESISIDSDGDPNLIIGDMN